MPHTALIAAFKDIGGVLAVAGIVGTAFVSNYRVGRVEQAEVETQRKVDALVQRRAEDLRLLTGIEHGVRETAEDVREIKATVDRIAPRPQLVGGPHP